MKQKVRTYKLKRSLGLFEATLYGVGIILGAGIYALIGVGAGIAGNALWLSFIVAALLAIFTGLSYAELAALFPREAAEYTYTEQAFKKRYLSFIVSWLMVFVGIVSSATVAFGFGGYFSAIFGGAPWLIAIILVALLSLLNWYGIKESARFNILATLIESAGLIFVVLAGLFFIFNRGITVNLLELPQGAGFNSIFLATAVIFFAYIGFETIANMAEEIKEPRRNIPKALLLSIAISTILYILVAISSLEVAGWKALAASQAPLAVVLGAAWGMNAGTLMAFIALFATANTVLIILIVTSRILYGMACQNAIPQICSIVGARGTPYLSVFLVGAFTAAAISATGIKTVALLTDMAIFIVYLFVNLSLIWLRYKRPELERPFLSPSIGRFPLFAVLGVVSSALMLFYFELQILAAGLAVIGAGYLSYRLISKPAYKV